MASTRREGRRERLDKANKFLSVIAGCGRRFFHHNGHTGRLKLAENGRLWYMDPRGKAIYLHYRFWGSGFSEGGTLRSLINDLRDYVMHGRTINAAMFGPWPATFCDGDLWGYGTDMEKVRAAAYSLGIVQGAEVEQDHA